MAKGIKILRREAWSMCLRSTAARSAVADDLKLLLQFGEISSAIS